VKEKTRENLVNPVNPCLHGAGRFKIREE